MAKNIETLIYEISLRVRLFMASKGGSNIADLTHRERLLLELIGMRENMSISEISNLCPTVSNSTISTTITRLWKDRKLVEKRILPENQRITTVSLTEQGRRVLGSIKEAESEGKKPPRRPRPPSCHSRRPCHSGSAISGWDPRCKPNNWREPGC